MIRKTTVRNREMFTCYLAGRNVYDLAQQYALAPVTVRQIINTEKLLLAVSPDPIYKAARTVPRPY